MENNLIIAIGRQFGSGGHEIGEKLAKKLGIKFYDKELIKLIAKESGLCEMCSRATMRSRRTAFCTRL